MGEKSEVNLVADVEKSKGTTLARFIFSLGSRHTVESMSKDLAKAFGSMGRLMDAPRKELQQVAYLEPVIASTVRSFFAQDRQRALLSDLIRLGVT